MKIRLLIIIGILLITTLTLSSAYASFSNSIMIYVEGSFTKMYYNHINLESVTFDYDSSSVVFETGANAELEIKTPIVYETGPNIFVLKNGEEIAPESMTDDCFYYINIQTEASEKIEIEYTYWPEYPQTLELCETLEVPPLKQTKLGISVDEIQCKENFVVFQKYDGTPACVMESTKNKLIERGWTTKDSSNIPEFDYELGESEFLQIKNNMENIGYHICDIQHEENKILIVLNWIFEDSEPEKMILSQIPNNVSYEIKYLGGYADYFISKESVFSCEGSENEN